MAKEGVLSTSPAVEASPADILLIPAGCTERCYRQRSGEETPHGADASPVPADGVRPAAQRVQLHSFCMKLDTQYSDRPGPRPGCPGFRGAVPADPWSVSDARPHQPVGAHDTRPVDPT